MKIDKIVELQNRGRTLFMIIGFICLLTTASEGQGGNGKIAGKVIDFQTKEALMGVNIHIDGTKLGATSDEDGRYSILNITPGKYALTASYIGYGKITQTEVVVYIDRTTRIDFELKDASVQIQAITVVAQKPKIIKDQTSTSSTLDEEQLRAAPIEGLRGALDMAASFQKDEKGDFQVRGSGTNEVSFLVNGVDQGNSNTSVPGWGTGTKADNSWKYDVNPLGVAQMKLIMGGYSAEYGNAQGAVISVVLKEGTPKFTGDVRVEYRPAGQYHWGNYIYDKSSFEWQTWGKREYWDQKAKEAMDPSFTGYNIFGDIGMSARDSVFYNKVRNGTASVEEKSMWESIAKQKLDWAYNKWYDLHNPSENNALGVYDYRTHNYVRINFGFGGPLSRDPDLLKFYLSGEYLKKPTRIPSTERDQIKQNYTVNLISTAVKENKFKFTGSFLKYVGGLFSGSEDIRWAGIAAFDKYHVKRDPVRTEQTTAQSLNWVRTIDKHSFFEATITHQYEKYELPYRYLLSWNYENDRLDSVNDLRGILLKNGGWWDQSIFDNYLNIATDFFQDNRSDQYSFKLDYTSQMNQMNLVKAGMQANYWDLVNSGVTYNFKANSYVTQQGVAEHYIAYPINASFYIQDKMEYEGMIANLGLRAEGYNFQADIPADQFNPFYPGTQSQGVGDLKTKRTTTKYVLLPRIGLSFPIGENTAFRMQYGHFASMPIFSQALGNSIFYGWSSRGNPDLEPKKTINYEFGIQQMLDEENKLDIALYYVDRVSQIGTQGVAAYTGNVRNYLTNLSSNVSLYKYNSFQNNMFGSTIGIDITLEKANFKEFGYRLSYTLSQTTDGVYGSEVLYPENASFYQTRITSLEHLSGSDRTHTFRGLFQYSVPDEGGIELFGIRPFAQLVMSCTYSVQSGLPFTYKTQSDLKDVVNNRRYPLESNFDLNFSKSLELSWGRILIAVRVMNLFNNKWLTPFSTSTESADMVRWLNNGVTFDQPDDPNKKTYLLYPYRAYRNASRQIFFTIGAGF